ncbi:MAG: hypothetical protein ACKVP7_21920 [Hyphomicrobiaceae bacterium]
MPKDDPSASNLVAASEAAKTTPSIDNPFLQAVPKNADEYRVRTADVYATLSGMDPDNMYRLDVVKFIPISEEERDAAFSRIIRDIAFDQTISTAPESLSTLFGTDAQIGATFAMRDASGIVRSLTSNIEDHPFFDTGEPRLSRLAPEYESYPRRLPTETFGAYLRRIDAPESRNMIDTTTWGHMLSRARSDGVWSALNEQYPALEEWQNSFRGWFRRWTEF